eukprot:TRINITY_DN2734_c0_g1_i1.p1 TRINITY_DN2734_c0_g1~~TRINITY_DN2734_c0_g1_i1.p1  ORF type:complete len:523 (+),score=163.38 TRINITY_DN2734_c0_g1_i1:46-1569(+)
MSKKGVKGKIVRPQEKETFQIDPWVDFASWFENIMSLADIVDKRYPVKGMYVFRPYGWFIHEAIMRMVEDAWMETGHEKVQFPLTIPWSFLAREEEHIAGFEKQCFWVTKGGLEELPEKLALRPTSETAMYNMFSLWVQSFRDFPLKVHQTCSVFRYETQDTKPLIRTREIFWNEAHTAHATADDALETLRIAWEEYDRIFENDLCVKGIRLRRPEWDKFNGAEHTDVLDVLMPCGRCLQAVGAHYLGQKFSKVFDIKYLTEANEFENAYMTCYGVSTRMMASCIAMNGDERGLILPPKLARYQAVIIPIINKKRKDDVLEACTALSQRLNKSGIRTILDDDTSKKPGDKYYHWEMKGVPIRIEVGPRDLDSNQVMMVTRCDRQKNPVSLDGLEDTLNAEFVRICEVMKQRSFDLEQDRVVNCSTIEEIIAAIENKKWARFPFHGMGFGENGEDAEAELKESFIGKDISAPEVRGYCPLEEQPDCDDITCVVTGKRAKYYAYAARCY